ncbi:prepilin peptidase [Kribbella sp. NPDC050470]|uniref:prepilin peptidase n=1 Tax=unclassified Kribbella TaxID=2644121 RepID=UPI0037A6B62E
MNLTWTVAGAVLGFAAGMGLRATVYRLSVAVGERAACAGCGVPISGRARCTGCRSWYGVPLVLELVTAAVLALLLSRFAGLPDAAAFAFIGAVGVALAAVDIAVQRLPDRLTLPLYPGLVALFGLAALINGQPAQLLSALLGGLVLGGGYLVLGMLSRGQLGGGDIKLAGGLGIALGWLGWSTLLTGAALGFVLMGVVSVVLLAARRVTLQHALSFGPFMLGGALVAVLTSA